MQAVAIPVTVHRALAPEETARADFYALLGRLFQAAPDDALLHQLAQASPIPADGDPGLAKAWQDLVNASSVMDAPAALDEYEALFGGVGKSAGRYVPDALIDCCTSCSATRGGLPTVCPSIMVSATTRTGAPRSSPAPTTSCAPNP